MNIGVSVYTNYEIQSLLNEEFISTTSTASFDNYFQRGEVFESIPEWKNMCKISIFTRIIF